MKRNLLLMVVLGALVQLSAQNYYDKTFNGTGWVNENITSDAQSYDDMLVQPDKKVLVSGLYLVGNELQPVLVRYKTNGEKDSDFGTGGIVKLNIDPKGIHVTSLGINSKGKIYVAGSQSGADGPFYLLRFNANGTPDNSFGNAGVLVDSAGKGTDDEHVYALTVQLDDKVLLTGNVNSYTNNRNDLWVARYKDNGHRDSSFGTSGMVKLNPFAAYYSSGSVNKDIHQPRRMMVLAGGKILIGGKYRSYTQMKEDFMLVRLNADGTYDKSFGGTSQGITIFGLQDIETVAGMACRRTAALL